MRVPKLLVDLLEWRWAPAAALSFGALVYVMAAIAVIPERIGASANSQGDSRLFATGPASTALFAARVGASLDRPQEPAESEPAQAAPHRPTAPPSTPIVEQSGHPGEVRRGFSPPLPRPEPEAPPPPPPLPAPPEPPPPPPQMANPGFVPGGNAMPPPEAPPGTGIQGTPAPIHEPTPAPASTVAEVPAPAEAPAPDANAPPPPGQ